MKWQAQFKVLTNAVLRPGQGRVPEIALFDENGDLLSLGSGLKHIRIPFTRDDLYLDGVLTPLVIYTAAEDDEWLADGFLSIATAFDGSNTRVIVVSSGSEDSVTGIMQTSGPTTDADQGGSSGISSHQAQANLDNNSHHILLQAGEQVSISLFDNDTSGDPEATIGAGVVGLLIYPPV